jgi:hypothetical protein
MVGIFREVSNDVDAIEGCTLAALRRPCATDASFRGGGSVLGQGGRRPISRIARCQCQWRPLMHVVGATPSLNRDPCGTQRDRVIDRR